MSEEDLTRVRKEHIPVSEKRLDGSVDKLCISCIKFWPCDAARLADEVESLQGQVEYEQERNHNNVTMLGEQLSASLDREEVLRKALQKIVVAEDQYMEPTALHLRHQIITIALEALKDNV